MIEVVDSMIGSFFVSIHGRIKGSEDFWLILGIYGCDSRLSQVFFEELQSMREVWLGFNEVMNLSERSRVSRNHRNMLLVMEFVDYLALWEFLVVGD